MLSDTTRELRSNRKAFRTQYSKTTEEIIKGIAKGKNSHEIASDLCVPLMTVAATKANFTRETYWPFAYPGQEKSVEGNCRF